MKATGLTAKVHIVQDGNLIAISGQRGGTINRAMGEIDTTSKDDTSGWETSIAGLRNWDVSLDGAWVLGDTALAAIEDSFMSIDHTPMTGIFDIYVTMPSGQGYSGQALATSLPLTLPHGDLITYTLNFKGTGPLRKGNVPQSLAMFSDSGLVIEQLAMAKKAEDAKKKVKETD